ncbi:MAG: hypothetical protein RI988_2730 [Pseudomonadota bacterium]
MAAAGPSLRAKALAWLALREHSTHELRTKLVRWAQARGRDAQAEGLDGLLAALQQAGHLSDARFIESRVQARSARLGNVRLELELRRNGVQPDEALRAELHASEFARAQAVWARRFGRGQPGQGGLARDAGAAGGAGRGCPDARAEQARQARFLAGRGFRAETIRRVLGSLPSPQDAPDEPAPGGG